MSDAVLIAPIRHRAREPPAYTGRALCLSQQRRKILSPGEFSGLGRALRLGLDTQGPSDEHNRIINLPL
jgi:hypothetical protein